MQFWDHQSLEDQSGYLCTSLTKDQRVESLELLDEEDAKENTQISIDNLEKENPFDETPFEVVNCLVVFKLNELSGRVLVEPVSDGNEDSIQNSCKVLGVVVDVEYIDLAVLVVFGLGLPPDNIVDGVRDHADSDEGDTDQDVEQLP